MAIYSHSRVSCYENCPYQYKLKYVDRAEVEVLTSVEAFLGDLVHRTLEKLYQDLKYQKTNSREELHEFFNDMWAKEYTSDIMIVKKDYTQENYRKMGEKFISDYYETYQPFDDMTVLGLETQDKIQLPDGNLWHVRIDRLGVDDGGNYYVCDYKTNSRMLLQDDADMDRQLAMYGLWVKEKFRDAKTVVLKWYMLAFNKSVVSERTDNQLEQLKSSVVSKIAKIEQATESGDFPINVSGLCDYCTYRHLCPSFKHEEILEAKTLPEYKKDDGLRLVDEYSETVRQIKELEERQEKLKGDLIEYSKQLEINAIYGSNMKVSVNEVDKILLPDDRNALIGLLKSRGLYDEYSMLNHSRISSQYRKKELIPEIAGMISVKKEFTVGLSKRKETDQDES